MANEASVGGMTRGFEHRLWGYKVVKIKQPDAERGLGSDSGSSLRPRSPTPSLGDPKPADYGHLGIVESSVGDGLVQHGDDLDQEKDECGGFNNVEPIARPVSEPSEGSKEIDERDAVGEWQIPETVLLTGESMSPF